MPIIAWIISALVWTFKSRIGLFIASALVWMGINYGTITMVLEPTITLLEGYMAAGTGGGGGNDLAATMFNWMGVLQFDRAATMIISAYLTRQALASARLAWFKRGTT